MAPKKPIPTAFAVVDLPKATKLAAAEGKVALMRRVHELTHDGEKVLAFLVRVMEGDGNVDQGLKAANLLLSYGYGKPVELTVTADATPQPQPGVASLSSEQLAAVVTGFRTDGQTAPKTGGPSSGAADEPEDAEIETQQDTE